MNGRLASSVLGLAATAALTTAALAESYAEQLPQQLQGAGVVERLNEQLPLSAEFINHDGERVTLGKYFQDDGRPVILTLNYYKCPQLCNLTLNGLVNALNDLEWTAGEEFQIVTVSFNPLEGPELADVKQRAYLNSYTRPAAKDGWHFHVGEREAIDALCRAAGFGYKLDTKSGDYAHSSTIIFCTPDGRISQYMNDTYFEPRDVRYALIEASQGAIGSPMDKLVLFLCFRYDPDSNSYVASAWKLMRLGGVVTVLAIGVGLTVLFMRGPKHAAVLPTDSSNSGSAT